MWIVLWDEISTRLCRLKAVQAALENELKSTTLAQVVADTRKEINEE